MEKDDTEKLRKEIDAIDAHLLELLNQRADLARRIGCCKKSAAPHSETYRPARELSHLRDLVERNDGLIQDASVVAVFREVMSACRALEQEISVAYLGPPGTYTMEAAHRQFGHSITTASFSAVEEVFRSVEAGESNYGVVPVENSSEGAVTNTLDCFVDSPLQIIGEVKMRISHCLLSNEKALTTIKKVYSHEQSFAQCRKWLGVNLPHCEKVCVASNAVAASLASKEEASAAIAGTASAEIEKLLILAKDIEDHPSNTTRFLVIGKQFARASGDDKTSVIVSAHNQPGALAKLLQTLASHQLSLTRIESRPARTTNWEYLFFLDIEGHCENGTVAQGLAELKKEASFYKLLGSYPCAVE